MKLSLFILLLALLGCQAKTDNSSMLNESVDRIESTPAEESFDDFFKKFTTDSLFQVQRVQFPFVLHSWDMDTDRPIMEKIDVKNWKHLPLEYKPDYAQRELDAYTQTTKIYTDSTNLELRGVDNGIMVDFNFRNVDGKWFLVSERDYSN
ncbi:MAG: DUF4348 domain-containing protein [Cyclobacteriaceae bacterium]|nr:DUF4348 domain-containing protein [Cyclobacteriaceae bacterium]